MASGTRNRLVVIPSDPIAAYEKKGIGGRLQAYYNPAGMFEEVFALSPYESGARVAHGMTIIGASEDAFLSTLENLQPSVVRAYGGFWPADLACHYRLPDVPVVVSVHDADRARVHDSVRYADIVICVSQAVENSVVARGVDPLRIRRLPNRVDTTVFHPVESGEGLRFLRERFPPGKHILHVGRKVHEKNLDTLIQALTQLPRDYRCVFVGAGDHAPYVQLAENIGVGDRCFWIEAVENAELPLWYSWCDCMCTPSRREGFGLVFIEAAACGAAIVTADIAPMNEYLRHGVSAHLVKDKEDPRSLAAGIRQVCEDAEYRRALSTQAVQAAQIFDRREVDAAEAQIYEEAIGLDARHLMASNVSLEFLVAARMRHVQKETAEMNEWEQRVQLATEDLNSLLPRESKFILVDEDQFREQWADKAQALPFLEKDGRYWGPPPDDATAIHELQRLQDRGARHLAFAWPAFWWLEHYGEFNRYLRSHFHCSLENERLVVFELKRPGVLRKMKHYGSEAASLIRRRPAAEVYPEPSVEWTTMNERIRAAKRIVDLGCGGNPHPRATVAVDAFLEPVQRALGQGPQVDANFFRERGVEFHKAELSALPFPDQSFDFAYAHHVFEHLPDPRQACAEMCRVARAGAIITPSIFSEVAFGRPYHLWLVIARGKTLVFIRKTAREDRPFGQTPLRDDKGKIQLTAESNPFDILLNDAGGRGQDWLARLGRLLRGYWYSHSPVTEVVFLWEKSFNCVVIDESGAVDQWSASS